LPVAYFGVLFLATRDLELSRALEHALHIAGLGLLTLGGAQVAVLLISRALDRFLAGGASGGAQAQAHGGFLTILKLGVWALAVLFLLDNLGFKISTMLATLGIGGVAVALAAQAVLGDVFSYFSIVLDRPFEIGDFIIVGDSMGVVAHIGIKSTRIASLGGEQIIISNKALTDSRVRNYKRMERRRVVFRFGVTYQTAPERLREIPELIAGIIRSIPETAFDRAHFFSYEDSSLLFEVVYYIVGNEYSKYMDIQQAVNLALFEAFALRKIDFAYPTRTVYVQRDP